jgi:DNA-binding XRE family transcriptional regulator
MALKRPIRDGFCSLHKCDNPPCVRNDGTAGHVFEGTKKDNTSDMMSKGRNRYKLPTIKLGEHHHQSRLTKDQVVEIKTRRNETKSSLAREFGVSRSTIRNIHDGKVWGWLKVS